MGLHDNQVVQRITKNIERLESMAHTGKRMEAMYLFGCIMEGVEILGQARDFRPRAERALGKVNEARPEVKDATAEVADIIAKQEGAAKVESEAAEDAVRKQQELNAQAAPGGPQIDLRPGGQLE